MNERMRLSFAPDHWRRHLYFVALLAILALALWIRLWRLTPPARGIRYAPDTDEGAYAFSAQLLLQGEMPYRDFFATLPPAGIYVLSAVLGVMFHPWGSLNGIMALRYASVGYGVATVGVISLIGRRIGGPAAGLLAALVLAVDGIVAGQDRRAMLESPMNLASALAIWLYIEGTMDGRVSRGKLLAAGALSGVAVMIKSPGAIVPLLLVGMTLLRGRWRDVGPLVGGTLVAASALAGPFLVLCPDEFLKQVYVFQVVRPADGLITTGERLREIWGYPYSWATVRLCWLGMIGAVWNGWNMRERWTWLLIILWGACTLALFMVSKSYWFTYFPQLALPLALLAGGTLAPMNNATGESAQVSLDKIIAPVILSLFVVWGILFGHFAVQIGATRTWLAFEKPAFIEVARYLHAHASSEDLILATDPLYGMLVSIRPATGSDGQYWPDTYGGMLYRNLGLADMSLNDIVAFNRELAAHADDTAALWWFHREPAQRDILSAFERTTYTVIDRRARRQWSPETLAYIREHSNPIFTIDDVTIYVRRSNY